MIKVTYDKKADAAYIYLVEMGSVQVSRTYLCDPKENNGMINIDFNSNNNMIGIEILDASKKLPIDILDSAIRIDK